MYGFAQEESMFVATVITMDVPKHSGTGCTKPTESTDEVLAITTARPPQLMIFFLQGSIAVPYMTMCSWRFSTLSFEIGSIGRTLRKSCKKKCKRCNTNFEILKVRLDRGIAIV